ncbi:MAG: hypothetical protein ACI8QD_002462, partial [Cyclobacteriaceae bacterium]
GLGYGLNSGWYNTGKPHKLLGFDITTGVSLATVPTDARFFTFNNADYSNIATSSGVSEQVPTMFGPNLAADDLAELTFTDSNGDEILRSSALTGIGIEEADAYPFSNPMVPAPYAQIGIGLIKNTEIKIRLVPEQNIDGNTFGSFGLGVMHDVKQWIPGMKLLPFDLSAFIGFNRLSASFVIDEDLDQYGEMNISGTTFQAIASKKLALLTVYGGLGFLTTTADFGLKGDYEVGNDILTDPVDFEFSSGGLRGNVGARIKILVLTLHAEYAIQKYNTLTVGVGISVR